MAKSRTSGDKPPEKAADATQPGFEERTAWRLFNAFTAVLTERSVSQPHGFVAQTMQLHHLMEQAV